MMDKKEGLNSIDALPFQFLYEPDPPGFLKQEDLSCFTVSLFADIPQLQPGPIHHIDYFEDDLRDL